MICLLVSEIVISWFHAHHKCVTVFYRHEHKCCLQSVPGLPLWWPWNGPESKAQGLSQETGQDFTVRSSMPWPALFPAAQESHLLTRGASGHWEGRAWWLAAFKCLSGTKYLTSRRNLRSAKVVATPRIYQIALKLCERASCERHLLSCIFYASENDCNFFF